MKLFIPFFGKVEVKKLLFGYLYVFGMLINKSSANRDTQDNFDASSETQFQLACMKGINSLGESFPPSTDAMVAAIRETGIKSTTLEIESRLTDIREHTRDQEYKRIVSDGYSVYKTEHRRSEGYSREPYGVGAGNKLFIFQAIDVRIKDLASQQECHYQYRIR